MAGKIPHANKEGHAGQPAHLSPDLKRLTSYNRGNIGAWHDALEALEQSGEVRLETADGITFKMSEGWTGRVWVCKCQH